WEYLGRYGSIWHLHRPDGPDDCRTERDHHEHTLMTQCFPSLNPDYFTNLIGQINLSNDEATLQALVNKEFGQLSYILSTLTSQEGFLNVLLTAPTDLPSVLTWITNFIAQLTGPLAK